MRAAFAFFAIFAAVLVSVAAAEEEHPFEYGVFEPAVADHGDRHRRLTCDLLSFTTKWVSVNHSACAAHCLALLRGYRGGFCDGQGVCVCRR